MNHQTEHDETSLTLGGAREQRRGHQRQSHLSLEVLEVEESNETQRLIENQANESERTFLCRDRIRFICERIGCQPETFVFGVYFFIFITMVYIIINKGNLWIEMTGV